MRRFVLLILCGCATLPAPKPTAPPPELIGEWELRWDRGFTDWSPAVMEGSLKLEKGQKGKLTLNRSSMTCDAVRIDGKDGRHLAATFKDDKGRSAELIGWFRDERFVGELKADVIPWSPIGGRRVPKFNFVPGHPGHSLPVAKVEGAGLDPEKLRVLLDEAKAQHSSAVIIVKNGEIVTERYEKGLEDEPIMAMSVSKSVVSLAVGLLIADGKLTLETPVSAIFTEWKTDPRSNITIRQLLSNTSGLDPERADVERESIREHGLSSDQVSGPGQRFQYNNNAADFLSAIVGKVAGVSMDAYLDARLFKKLDFVGAHWRKDAEGTPRGAGELLIRPVDLAKLGQLMLDGGKYRGEQLIPAEWVAKSVEASQPYAENCGLLWWRDGKFAQVLTAHALETWRAMGISSSVIERAKGLTGKRFASWVAFRAALKELLDAAAYAEVLRKVAQSNRLELTETVGDGPVIGFSAQGWLGQFLVVVPEHRLVAVRMRRATPRDSETESEHDGFSGFVQQVGGLGVVKF